MLIKTFLFANIALLIVKPTIELMITLLMQKCSQFIKLADIIKHKKKPKSFFSYIKSLFSFLSRYFIKLKSFLSILLIDFLVFFFNSPFNSEVFYI